MRRIFRQEALERLSSPERLDQLMQVVSPHNWLVLGTLLALLGLALAWAVVGRLPTTVAGRGVLMRPRKVVEWQAPAAGRLASLTVSVGDRVRQGAVLGAIDQADMHHQLHEERAKLQELQAQDSTKDALQAQQMTLQLHQIALEKTALNLQQQDMQQRLRDAQAKTPLLKERLENRRRLETMGLAARLSDERLHAEQAYLDNQHKIAELTATLAQLDSQRTQLDSKSKSLTLQGLEASTSRKNQIQELRRSIALREGQLQRTSEIISDYDGRVLELTFTIGQRVQAGLRLGSIEVEDVASALVGLTYFPIKAGKKVQPGMQVLIAPDTVERERFGSMLATVTSVSAFPVTREGMLSLVGNAEVVATLVTQGPALEVVTALAPDPETFSHYKWSSSKGPELHITSGTTVTARVVVEQRAPMTYLLPFLRETSGLN
jgi:HlyD family secretion protein